VLLRHVADEVLTCDIPANIPVENERRRIGNVADALVQLLERLAGTTAYEICPTLSVACHSLSLDEQAAEVGRRAAQEARRTAAAAKAEAA
jgi:hypothetical protein